MDLNELQDATCKAMAQILNSAVSNETALTEVCILAHCVIATNKAISKWEKTLDAVQAAMRLMK